MIKQNQLRPLAVTSSRRSRFMPDLPSMTEHLPGTVVDSWQAFFAPAGTPPEIVAAPQRGVRRAAEDEGSDWTRSRRRRSRPAAARRTTSASSCATRSPSGPRSSRPPASASNSAARQHHAHSKQQATGVNAMPRKPVLFNEQRLQAMMDRQGDRRRHPARHRELEIHHRVLPQRRQSRLPAVHGVLLPRSRAQAGLRGAGGRPAPRDDVDLDRGRARLRDGGVLHRPGRAFLPGLLRGRAGDPRRAQRQGPDHRHRGREPHLRLPRDGSRRCSPATRSSTWRSTWTSCAWSRRRRRSAGCARRPRSPSRRTRASAPRSSPATPTRTSRA